MRSRRHALALALVLAPGIAAACGESKAPEPNAAPPAASAPAPAPAGGGKGSCPATGLWAACSILDRLDRAGLAPRRDSSAAREDALSQPGILVKLGGAELELFLYADSASRQRDEAKLDKRKFIEATQEPSLAGERTLIRSANLLAILNSKNGHQRERVSDAITAGPPQP